MREIIGRVNSIENINNAVNNYKENLSIFRGIDERGFDKLVKSFLDEKEQNRILVSGFLNKTKVPLIELGNIKIDINHIKNYVRNKPDISKDLEIKISKLFLKNLYESGYTNLPFIMALKDAFGIESKSDIDNMYIDFKIIQVNIQKISPTRDEKINSTVVTNDELFELLKRDINKYANFESQNLSSQAMILDILQFEVKGIIDYMKSRGEEVERDMESIILPTSAISGTFDKAKDPEIEKLIIQKGKLAELENLLVTEDIYHDRESLKEYIKGCENVGIDPEVISKLEELLLYTINEQKVREFYYNEIKKAKKRIWKKYIENFEKMGMDPEFISALKKLVENDFNFSELSKREQTILWNILIVNNVSDGGNQRAKYINLDQEEFQKFLQDLYNFEKDDLKLTIDGVGDINLKIKKEVKDLPIASFSDVENFRDMSITQPIRFTVNIDDNTEEIIQDLESEGENGDNFLRVNGLIETHITKGGPISIGNGYELELCGKTITKKQLDDLLLCKDLPELNEKLKDFGLFADLEDVVYSTRREIFQPQNVYSNLDEDGFDMAPASNSGEISFSDKHSIFEEVLKKIEVKVTKRDLVFDGKNIDKLSQLYILSKLGGDGYTASMGKQQDKKTKNILGNYDKVGDDDEELGGKEKGEKDAENYRNDYLKDDYDSRETTDADGNYIEYEIGDRAREAASDYWEELNSEGREAFKTKLKELCDNDPDLEEAGKEEIKSAIDDMIDGFPSTSESNTDSTDTTEGDDETDTIDNKTDPIAAWRATWDGLSGDKDVGAKKDKQVENNNEEDEDDEERESIIGSRLYFDLGESQLPPKDITDSLKSYYCFEVTKLDTENKTFTLKAIGGDIKSSLTGNEYELSMDQLDSITKKGNVYKVRSDESRDWTYCLESINKAGFFKKFTAFGNMEGQVHLDGNKFVNEKGEEIKYFDRVEGAFDDSKPEVKDWGQGSRLSKYEIKKIDKTKGTVKLVSSFNGYDENYKEVKYNYENELPFEQFILLMEGKRLKGYTQKEQEEMEVKYAINDPKRLPTKGRRRWISIGSIINVFKNTTKAIKGKIDENKKDQEDVLENYLFSKEGLDLYGKSRRLLGDIAEKMQYDFYTNRENRTWKKIEEWYKIFESDPNYSEFFAEHLQHILARKGYVGNDKDRYKFAAAFLIMVKKEGPYPRVFANEKDKGKRVENLLGPEHKIRFLNFYEKKKNELEQERDLGHQSGARLALQEELNKMEIQYIVSTIDGRAPYGPLSNEFMLKSVWGLKFMSTLEENAKGYYNKHEEEKNSLETFYAAEESYLRNMGSGKFQKALPALERMCEVCKTPGEVYRVKGYLLGAMLMGTIKNNSSAKTIKSFWGTCRSMGFAPGYWMRDIEQQDKIKILLDGVTNGGFSKETKFNVSEFEPGNIKDSKYSFTKKFQSYWNSHGSDILKKIEDPTYKTDDGDKSIIDLANEKDNPNNYIFKDIIKNSTTNEIDSTNGNVPPIFAQESPLSATSNIVKSYIPEGGKYSKVKNEEDISNAEDFWSAAEKAIPSAGVKADKDTVDFIFKKYFNRFDSKLTSNVQTTIIRSIPLIQQEKEKGHVYTARYMLWYMIKGYIHEATRGAFPKPEFEAVMNKFVDFFFTNIDKISKSTIKSTFDADAVTDFENPYVMLDWKQFRNYIMQTTNGGRNKNTYDRLVRIKLHIIHKEKTDAINYQIGDMWNKIRHYSEPDCKPEELSIGEDDSIIHVNMKLSDKEIKDRENKEIYGMAA